MAEGLLKDMASDFFDVFSAGSHPSIVNSMSIEVMKEVGIDISSHRSEPISKYLNIGKSFFPVWAKPLKVFFRLINIFSKKGVSYYYTAYIRYFMDYSWFYPQRKYSEYLKDSKYHRNVVSYWTKYFLKEQKH